MRGVKAEGGWAVVSTEEIEIHASSDISPYIEGRLWDDRDVAALALMTDAIHEYGALAAIELVHAGMNASNLYSREVSTGTRLCAHAAPDLTLFMSTQAMEFLSPCTSCQVDTTTGRTNTAAAWRSAPLHRGSVSAEKN
jgi:2,4-dienoyl-CoA reductase-like NADH-dependent reductase (Old Yellow Enzyme family)